MSKELNSIVVSMAERIKPHMEVSGNSVNGDDSLFAASLEGTGLTPEIFDKCNDHLTTLVSAVTLAHGDLAGEVFVANKDIDRTNAVIPLNKGMGINQTIKREAEVPNFDKENPGTRTVYGQTTTRFDFIGTANKGEYKKTRQHVSAHIGKLVAGINS